MATAMAGASTLTSTFSLCKASHSYCSISPTVSHSNLNCMSPLPSFQQISKTRSPKKSHFGPDSRSALGLFISWKGGSHFGLSFQFKPVQQGRRRKHRVVKASLFGVGAPEALVIGVVALLVFGPKGLAEVARTLGKSFRAFQPTIRELQEVSREFKNTLEQEIGLDELSSPNTNASKSAFQTQERQTKEEQNEPSAKKAYSTEDYLRVTEEEIKALVPEEHPKAVGAANSDGTSPSTAKSTTDVAEHAPKQGISEDGKANNDQV